MRKRKSYYELSRSQVDTPPGIVRAFWSVFGGYRTRFSSVLDLGAGDGRFAFGGRYGSYLGIEIDSLRKATRKLPVNATLRHGCAFRHEQEGYAACIGNPPYVRHHDLEPEWRDRIAQSISAATGYDLNRKCNLYVYFLFLSLLKTSSRGIAGLIVPYDWLSRPAAEPLRDFIRENEWSVDAFRFSEAIFPGVETTASISVIDKRNRNGRWTYHKIDSEGRTAKTKCVTGGFRSVLPYSQRGETWAMRGMSPGTQRVFTLTEGQRIHAGLARTDVYPCVTSMRDLPDQLKYLNARVFHSRLVNAGQKCWLIKSDRSRLSKRLRAYLDSIPEEIRDTHTCVNRDLWYRFKLSPAPDLLVSSGFVGTSPKTLVNAVGAYAVGGIHGVYDVPKGRVRELQKYLSGTDFSSQVVAHSGHFRKLEVQQLNSILQLFLA
ncbi:MAG: class I SAM-dependent methyltransferase [Planctomycetota bacterium]